MSMTRESHRMVRNTYADRKDKAGTETGVYEDTGMEPEDISAPTIDAVPVVRCRECKHYQHYGKTSLLEGGKHVKAGWCYRRIRFDEESRMPADGFCSYGQRKEADHEAEKEPAPDI